MKNTLKLDLINKMIIMDRTFAKNCENTMSDEYEHLQKVREDYPTFRVVQKRIKRNPNKETYKGLTYAFMFNYINSHETEAESRGKVIAEFNELLTLAKVHKKGKGYAVIKKWFLTLYPTIESFGQDTEELMFDDERIEITTLIEALKSGNAA